MEQLYSAKYSLKQILSAIGLNDFKDAVKAQPRLATSTNARQDFMAAGIAGAIQQNLSYSPDLAFKTLSNAIASDLTQFVLGIDNKALVRKSLTHINIYLLQADQLANNTTRIYKFLKAREKRYSTLIKYSGAIDKALKRDALNAKRGDKKQTLYLRLNSLKQIKNMGQVEFNRLLDDIIANLEYNTAYAGYNEKINPNGKVYQKHAVRNRAKWED